MHRILNTGGRRGRQEEAVGRYRTRRYTGANTGGQHRHTAPVWHNIGSALLFVATREKTKRGDVREARFLPNLRWVKRDISLLACFLVSFSISLSLPPFLLPPCHLPRSLVLHLFDFSPGQDTFFFLDAAVSPVEMMLHLPCSPGSRYSDTDTVWN